MVIAKCIRCLGSAEGSTFSEASSKIDHGVGKSRGKPCGASYNAVIEVGASSPKPKSKKSPTKKSTPKPPVEKSATPVSEDTKE